MALCGGDVQAADLCSVLLEISIHAMPSSLGQYFWSEDRLQTAVLSLDCAMTGDCGNQASNPTILRPKNFAWPNAQW